MLHILHPRPSSLPRSLTSMSPAEVHAIVTPRSQQDLRHLTQSLSLDLQNSNIPRTWRIRHVVDKISNTSIAAPHMRPSSRATSTGNNRTPRKSAAQTQTQTADPRRRPHSYEQTRYQTVFRYLEAESKSTQFSKLRKTREKAAKSEARVQEPATKKKYRAAKDEGRKFPAFMEVSSPTRRGGE